MADSGDASDPTAMRLWMEIELGADPIRGTLALPDLETRPFTGWLELTAALERLRELEEASDGSTPDPSEPHRRET